MSETRRSALRYALAVGLVAVAVGLESLLLPLGHERPFLLLFGAIVLAAWYGGRGPAVLALALATVVTDFFFLSPYLRFTTTPGGRLQLGLFVLEAAAACVLAVAAREARARAVAAARSAKCAEEQLRRLNQAHRALSTCNEILVRAGREEGLLQEICQAIVDVAGYRMCWVGYAEHDAAKSVRPIAVAGHEDGYLQTVNVTWADVERGRGPTGTAVRTGRPSIRQDVADDPAFGPWRPEALKRGYASVLSLPLRIDDRVFGALSIYASESGAFDEDAVRLLSELTSDLGYGVGTLRARRDLEAAYAAVDQASRAKDEFVRIAAHELRTPLTPILGWAQILAKATTRDPESLARGLAVIHENARQEARLIDDLLDISCIAAGDLRTELHPVELGPIVAACVDEARPAAAAKGVELTASIAPDTALAGDARRLRQVVDNLLSNALKFTPRGGRISVEVTRKRDALSLKVRDTGKGITASELPHVFEPFHPGDRSMTRTEGGLGLGLCIVRYIVEAHGGTVRAESAGPGRGATLIAELHAAQPSQPALACPIAQGA